MANKKSKSKQRRPLHPVLLRAKHIFVPHKGNNYHPHLIRKHGLAIVLVLALSTQLVYTFATTGKFGVLGRVTDVTVSGLLDGTNQARQSSGLSPLSINSKLNQAAYAKAQDMLAKNYWAHTSPDGTPPWKWFSDYGYSYDSAGENLAKNYPTSDAVIKAWLASPTHRANVLNSKYQDVGFAVVDGNLQGQNTLLVVALYAQPVVGAVLASTDLPMAGQFQAAQALPQSPIGHFGSLLQNLNPATLGSLVMFVTVILVAVVTYTYRKRIPKNIRRAWYAHHSLYKAASFAVLAILVVVLSRGGQI